MRYQTVTRYIHGHVLISDMGPYRLRVSTQEIGLYYIAPDNQAEKPRFVGALPNLSESILIEDLVHVGPGVSTLTLAFYAVELGETLHEAQQRVEKGGVRETIIYTLKVVTREALGSSALNLTYEPIHGFTAVQADDDTVLYTPHGYTTQSNISTWLEDIDTYERTPLPPKSSWSIQWQKTFTLRRDLADAFTGIVPFVMSLMKRPAPMACAQPNDSFVQKDGDGNAKYKPYDLNTDLMKTLVPPLPTITYTYTYTSLIVDKHWLWTPLNKFINAALASLMKPFGKEPTVQYVLGARDVTVRQTSYGDGIGVAIE